MVPLGSLEYSKAASSRECDRGRRFSVPPLWEVSLGPGGLLSPWPLDVGALLPWEPTDSLLSSLQSLFERGGDLDDTLLSPGLPLGCPCCAAGEGVGGGAVWLLPVGPPFPLTPSC